MNGFANQLIPDFDKTIVSAKAERIGKHYGI